MTRNGVTERSAEWVYRGIWRVLTDCFRVPKHPPRLPDDAENLRIFHPSRRYLAYLKMYFWVALVVVDAAILIAWLTVLWLNPVVGWVLAVPAAIIAIVPDIIGYVAIHLRYDTIWYGVSDRGIYIRRGIVVIIEHSITLENVQNVAVSRGPVEQLFGIGSVVVETAGAAADAEQNPFEVGNKTIMVGLDNADEILALVMARVQASRSAGLGDDHETGRTSDEATQTQLLTDILHDVRQLRPA